jgi:asparagine synthase (glutamine-hydrolysing)
LNKSVDEICFKLRLLLQEAVKRNLTEGILLSGGLDTSILVAIASKSASLKAFTVALEDAPAPDVQYAASMASRLELEHVIHYFKNDELYDAIRVVVKTIRSFDPMEIRNSIVVYVGLRVSKEHGIRTVMTGDGCDELFAGYSFLFELEKEQLDLELQKLWNVMQFSSIELAKALGITAKLPYLDPDLKSFAMKIDSSYKVRDEKGMKWGKWIVRKAFESILPEEIVWRVKTPIECGSGTSMLPNFFNEKISDEEFKDKKCKCFDEDKVMIRDKEQLFYYEVYRSAVGVPRPADLRRKLCPQCSSNVADGATYCRTCGAYPI